MVGTEVEWAVPALLRGGCSGWRPVPFRDRPGCLKDHGVLWQVHRSDTLFPSRLDNDEGEDGGAVTSVSFEERGSSTRVVMHDLYPSKEAPDAILAGMEAGMSEALEQLDEFVVSLGATLRQSRL